MGRGIRQSRSFVSQSLCAWTAGTLVHQQLNCSCDFLFSSTSLVAKFLGWGFKEDRVVTFRDV